MPNYLAKYGCNVKITKTQTKTTVLITSNERKFKIIFKEILDNET